MISITIGQETRTLGDDTEQWINQQITRRGRDGGSLCVQVKIDQPPLNMVLSTPQCSGSGGGSRLPTDQEQAIFDLWARRGLNQRDFTGGSLISFLKQLRP